MKSSPVLARSLCMSAAVICVSLAGPVLAQSLSFDVSAQNASSGLQIFARQAGIRFVASARTTRGKRVNAVRGQFSIQAGLERLLAGTGLEARPDSGGSGIYLVRPAAAIAKPTSETTRSAYEPGEIIVTAQKRSERLQDVPMTINVLDPDTMVNQNQTQLKDYLSRVPGVSLEQSRPGRSTISIRGISSSDGNPLIGITIDDIPFGASTYLALGSDLRPDLDPADLSSIQVLKGPQGTLYGASSMGGLIKYETVSPDLKEASARIQVDGSSVAHGGEGFGMRASYSTPVIADRLAVRVSGFYRQDPGFIDDPRQGLGRVNDNETYGGRVALAGQITDTLKIRASALYQKTISDGTSSEDVDVDFQPITGKYQHSRVPGSDGYRTEIQFYNLSLDQDLGFASLSSLTGYSRVAFSSPLDSSLRFGGLGSLFYGQDGLGFRFDNNAHNRKFSEELRLSSNGSGPFSYIAGLFYTHEKTLLVQQINTVDPQTGAPLPVDLLFQGVIPTTYDEYAAFANATYAFSDKFDIQGGVRIAHNKQTFMETDYGLLGGGAVSGGTAKESPFTYSVSPRLHLGKDVMVYGRVASGYRAGGPNASPPPGIQRTFKSDSTVNYELGIKADLLDRRLTTALSAFYIDWKDIQANVTDPDSGFGFSTNEGKARAQGIEASFQYSPVDGLALSEAFAYTDATLRQDVGANSSIFALKGDRLPYVAKWANTASADYRWDAGERLSPFVGMTVAYTSSRQTAFAASAELPRIKLPGYTSVDLRAGVVFRPFTATLFVKNVGDSRGYVGSNALASRGPFALTLINPRTVGLSLSAAF